jgi:uncharacterized protein (TIGR03086 family)
MGGSRVSECPLNEALQSTLAILTKVRSDDLAAPTPCASWDVRALISHFVGTARWWAAAIGAEDAAADVDYTAGDFVGAYEESIRIAVAAFAAEGALDKTVRLPFGEFPGVVVRNLAAMEQFTHGWDVARAIGYSADLDPELAAGLLSQARLVIADSYRGPDGQARDRLIGLLLFWGGVCDLCLIARHSSRAPSRSGVSCSRTAIACSARSLTPKTWSRRPTCVPGALMAGSRAGRRCAPGYIRSPPMPA